MQRTIFGIESAEFTHRDVCDVVAALMHAGAYAGTGTPVGLLEPRRANQVAVLRELKRRGYAKQRSTLSRWFLTREGVRAVGCGWRLGDPERVFAVDMLALRGRLETATNYELLCLKNNDG